jgi:hypothetical protein
MASPEIALQDLRIKIISKKSKTHSTNQGLPRYTENEGY